MWGEILGAAADVALTAGRIKILRDEYIPRVLVMLNETGSVTISGVARRFAISQKDARLVLYGACQPGLIYEAVNGKFYRGSGPAPKADTNLSDIKPITYVEESSRTYAAEIDERTQRRTGRILLTVLVLTIGGPFLLFATRSKPAHVTTYEPSASPASSSQPTQLDIALNGTAPTPSNATEVPPVYSPVQAIVPHSHRTHKPAVKHHHAR